MCREGKPSSGPDRIPKYCHCSRLRNRSKSGILTKARHRQLVDPPCPEVDKAAEVPYNHGYVVGGINIYELMQQYIQSKGKEQGKEWATLSNTALGCDAWG